MKRRIFLTGLATTALVATGVAVAPLAAQSERSTWSIGPIIKGKNRSHRMPATMQPTREGASFDFPYPTPRAGHVHYVTTRSGSLANAKRIVMRYRIDAAPGTRFVPEEDPHNQAVLSLYFQRAGDSWTMRTPRYRWYSPANQLVPLTPGTHEIAIDMDEEWIAMTHEKRSAIPQDFRMATARAGTIGFTFGSASLRGHGVYATGPARFTLLDFRVE
ncbi:hypothetical protein [Alteriqipengyuania sp.]|uniref:hypothetical protein n=1 Tax=Alteriqipengyuania sp. TaxID=2800692 RepID=UPI003515B95B